MALTDLVDYFVTLAATITTGSGYANTVAAVNSRPVNALTEGSDKFPSLDILPENTAADSSAGNTRSSAATLSGILVEGWVQLTEEQRPAPWVPMLSLLDDAKKAVRANRTAGGHAVGILWPPRVEFLFGADEAGFQMHLQVKHIDPIS